MDQAAFEAKLAAAGYTQIETKALDPRPANTEHAHDHDIRGLVLDGIFIVRHLQAGLILGKRRAAEEGNDNCH